MSNAKKSLIQLAAYYGQEITKVQLDMYADQLSRNLSDSEMSEALRIYIDNPSNEFFPRPVSKLIALVKKPVENKDQAQNILNLIKKAVINHQSTWTQGYFSHYDESREPVWDYFNANGDRFQTWRDAAISEIGEMSVLMIERMGGWKQICERFDQEPEGVVIGQLAKNIESIINIAEAGQLEVKPVLPTNNNVLKLLNIKTLNKEPEALEANLI